MKYLRILSALLALLLLPGCGGDKENAARFYYLRTEIEYGTDEGVIAPEPREDSGTLSEMLTLYLQGPLTDTLTSPFPDGTSLVEVTDEGEYLDVKLNARLAILTGMELTLACGCLAQTCFALTGAEEVRISAGDALLDGAKYITIAADSLLFSDGSAQ